MLGAVLKLVIWDLVPWGGVLCSLSQMAKLIFDYQQLCGGWQGDAWCSSLPSFCSRPPGVMELQLFFATLQPMKSQIHGFACLWEKIVGKKCMGCGVVGLYRCSRLGWLSSMSVRCNETAVLVLMINAPSLAVHDGTNDLGDLEDSSVILSGGVITCHEHVSSCAAVCFRFGEVGGITVD